MPLTTRRAHWGALGGALALLLALAPSAAAQGVGTITGTVVDDQGVPVIQGNVVVVELNRGAATDIDGQYTLGDVPAGTYVLRASYTGFEPQQTAVTVVAGQTVTQNFTLAPVELGTVVVEGYRVRRQAVESGAASQVQGRDVETLTVRSADAALQGRAAGVRVTSVSGQPGAGIQVRVRGSGSITAGRDPLYVVDGVQISNDNELARASGNPLAAINPTEIESIEVLKDAAATSIYGAQGANGVVLVTTKRGQAGRTQIELSSQLGYVDRITDYEVLSAPQYLTNRFESLRNFFVINQGLSRDASLAPAASNAVRLFGGRVDAIGGPNAIPIGNDANGVAQFYVPEAQVNVAASGAAPDLRTVDTNWQNELFQTGVTQQYSAGARGGNERTRFYVQGRYANDEGQILASDFRQYGLRVNLDHNMSDWAQFETSLNLSDSNYRGTIGNGAFINSPYWAAQFIPPTAPLYNIPGDPESGFNLRPNSTFSANPVAQETFDTRNSDLFRLIGNGAINLTLPYGFITRSYAGVNFGDAQEQEYRDGRLPSNTGLGTGGVSGNSFINTSRTTEFNLSQSVQWNRLFNTVNNLDLLGVVEYRRGFEDDAFARAIGFPLFLFRTLASAAEPVGASSNKTEFRFLSYVGNAEYTYDNTYQLATTLRFDGSSRFGQEDRFGLFGAVAAYARLNRIGGMRDLTWLDDLKLRASYGQTGNSNVGNFASRALIGGAGEYSGQPGIQPTQLPNIFLTWEELRETNLGLDYSVFNGRVNGAVDVYNRDSDQLLLDRDLPSDSGFGSITENVGLVRQQGLEFAINTTNVDNGLFRWRSTFNIAFQRAEVKELAEGTDEIVVGGLTYRVGEAPAQYRYVNYAGVNPANGRPFYYDTEGNLTYNPEAVAFDDRPLQGNDNPDFFGGFGNTFSVGPVALDVFFQYDYGRTTLNNNAYFSDVDFNFNKSDRVLDRWQAPGDVTAVPAPIFRGDYNDGTSNFAFTTRFLEDASYIRLKQLALSFQVPQRYLGTFARNARLYVQGENLVTFTEFTDTDPELVGTALGQYPQSRRITAGITLGL